MSFHVYRTRQTAITLPAQPNSPPVFLQNWLQDLPLSTSLPDLQKKLKVLTQAAKDANLTTFGSLVEKLEVETSETIKAQVRGSVCISSHRTLIEKTNAFFHEILASHLFFTTFTKSPKAMWTFGFRP